MYSNHAKKIEALSIAIEDFSAPSIILVRPSLHRNVGTVARAMLNFGLTDLRLVDPKCDHLSGEARALATQGATGPRFCLMKMQIQCNQTITHSLSTIHHLSMIRII